MEPGVTSTMGAMGPVLRKLDLLLAPESGLRKRVKDGIELLKEDLEEVSSALVDLSILEAPSLSAKCWMQEARELSYHIDDFIDDISPMRGDADAKIRSILRHRVGRVKIAQLPHPPRRGTRMAKIAELRALLWQASERLERYQLDTCCRSLNITGHQYHYRQAPALHGDVGNLVGIEDSKIKLIEVLNLEAEQKLKVVSVVGTAGVGKTTLAKEIFRELGEQFELRAFVRASRNLDMRRFLGSILSQVRQDHELPSVTGPVQSLIDNIQGQLQDKRYLIVIDDLWEETSWDIISGAFPKVNTCSRIVATTEIIKLALKCCSYMSDNVFKMEPLGIKDSRSLFFNRLFGSEQQCPDALREVSFDIIKKCGGLPLLLINIAGLLSRQLDYSELWYHYVHDRLCSILNGSHTVQEIQEKILNLSYNSLPNCLKTCLLYFNMYPEDYVIWKVHLVKQWIAEGFINATEGKNTEETAEGYFDELVRRGMIQPMQIHYTDEMLSCTVHHIIHDLISHNSKEEEFIAAIDYSQNVTGLCTKALRLSFRFSSAKYTKKPAGITMSQLRSISFFGFIKCIPPIVEFKHLRVMIFDFLGTHDGMKSLNLSRICTLFQLRYLKISGDIMVELPAQMQSLHYLETLDIDARVSAVPLDIVYLPSLLHLGLHDAIKLPDGIGRIKSLTTLWYFDLRCNSKYNIQSLGNLTDLQHLHLTCSAALSSDHLKRKLMPLASSLGKLGNLKSLILTPDALRTAIFFDISSGISSPSIFLQRLELLPPICLFSRLPTWIGELQKLRILKIGVKELRGNDIDNIAGLPSLVVFSLYVRTALIVTIIFSNMAFPALKYFKFTCGVTCLAFQAGAMPNLQRLKLCFNAHRCENHSRVISGIEHLLNLQEVAGQIGESPVGDGSNSRFVKLSIEDTIRKHPSCPRISLKFVDLIEEEYPPLDKFSRRQQEDSLGEHGIMEEGCVGDPNKHVDNRFPGAFDLPSAPKTSSYLLKSGIDNLIHHQQIVKTEIIIWIHMKSDKHITNAVEVAAAISGVESVRVREYDGDKSQLLVIGKGVDLKRLVNKLMEMGEAEIMEVRAHDKFQAAALPLLGTNKEMVMEAAAAPSVDPNANAKALFKRHEEAFQRQEAFQDHMAFQNHVAATLVGLIPGRRTLASRGDAAAGEEFLSIAWIRRLLEAFMLCHDGFRALPAYAKSMIDEFHELAIKALYVCSATHDGIEQLRSLERLGSIAALPPPRKTVYDVGHLRRVRKALADLSILLADNATASKNSGGSTSSASRMGFAARQMQAIGVDLTALYARGASLPVPFYSMACVLHLTMWALIAAIVPFPDRASALQEHLFPPVPLHAAFPWAPPLLDLQERLAEEGRRKDRRHFSGLLKEICSLDKSMQKLAEAIDSAPVFFGDRAANVREAAAELAAVCEAIRNGLDPLERQVREVFHLLGGQQDRLASKG